MDDSGWEGDCHGNVSGDSRIELIRRKVEVMIVRYVTRGGKKHDFIDIVVVVDVNGKLYVDNNSNLCSIESGNNSKYNC